MISFIIPALQEETVIEKTLTALRKLQGVPFEIIVSDGGSTDRTVKIAQQYANQVVVHDGKTRQNIAQGRNAGAAVANGVYLIFLDADVEIPSIDAFFEKALLLFATNERLVGLSAKYKVFENMETRADRIIWGCINALFILKNNLLRIGGVGGELQMVRAETFRSISGYDERLVTGEDHDLFYRLSKKGRTHVEPSLFFYHTGRRAHVIGWPKLLWQWTCNVVWNALFHRSRSKEWEVIR